MTALAKERGSLAKMAMPYGRYLELGRQIAEAEALCAAETDSEMRSYAEAELDDAPRPPAARSARRSATCSTTSRPAPTAPAMIVEIRAGTGGDEAALFARDLYEMYRRYRRARWAGSSRCWT